MKRKLLRWLSVLTAMLVVLTTMPFEVFAQGATYAQMVNAATHIIITNEGNYSTVVRNDNGALSIGIIGWHATNALNLLKDIIARNPSQALNILGASLYNEILTSSYWETKIPDAAQASAISVLISTAEGKAAQDKFAYDYISGYVDHAIKLGLTEPSAIVFLADYQNQNGYTGAERFFRSVVSSYGVVNLETLYNSSSKNNRRTRTYNFCRTVNWSDYTNGFTPQRDTTPPEISNVVVSGLDTSGYTVSCEVSDNIDVTEVYFAVYRKAAGAGSMIWYKQTPSNGKASHRVDISEFSGSAGGYCTYIYAFDASGNYAYVELNVINVPTAVSEKKLSVTVSSNISSGTIGDTIKWSAAAADGSGNYSYSFSLYKNNTEILKRNYLDYSDFTYTANEPGVYAVYVSVYDNDTKQSASVLSKASDICTPIEVRSLKANKSAAILGEMISWNIDASGGEGDLKYQYSIYRNDVIVYSGPYSDKTIFPYKATSGGIYKAVVNIMDEHSQVSSAESEKITVIEPLRVDDITFSKSYAVAGMSVTCTADIHGGTGNYSCIFTVYRDGEAIITSDVLNDGVYTFTVPEGGVYTADIVVTDIDTSSAKAEGGGLTADSFAKKGDANCDGNVNAADARFALRVSARLEYCEPELEYAADVDGNGKVTAADARIILRVVAKLQTF